MVSTNDQNEASYLKSLIEMAHSDGLVDEQEIILLNKVAARFNLSTSEIKEIKKHHRKVNFVPPSEPLQRVEMIYDMVQMMMIDGHIDDKEMQLCNKYAKLLDFKPENITQLIKIIYADIARGKSKEKTQNKIETRRLAS